ncbi:hypothetical protein LTR56_006701 [Elasticomyces elasticus]|nr:hypothetical protein LTR22_017712 [Elasticomyces elasticus]KAK3649802.1 hypothetical protein LTR56_006701 [Elasticomyces elasticus]KAK4913070.1 hypothetical protein LTR49_018536 [Elasticomyces elasticus]KAK5762494.1 hypothetical protein LTS12_007285 [Elasticomyces elasticus]
MSRAKPATRQNTRHAAFNAVLLTTELLENILQHLPTRDLLLSQRVSRKWRSIISQSADPQQQLSMLPREAEFAWEFLKAPDGPEGPRRLMKVPLETYRQKRDELRERGGDRVFQSGVRNTLLCKDYGDEGMNISLEYFPAEYIELKRDLAALHKQGEPSASWRKMYLTQPTSLECYGFHNLFEGGALNAITGYPDGVKAGDIASEMVRNGVKGKDYFFHTTECLFPLEREVDMKTIEW